MTNASDEIRARDTAIRRGLDFVHRFGSKTECFESYGSFLICCFALVGATSRDPKLRQLGRGRAEQFARRWTRGDRVVAFSATADLFRTFIQVRYALNRLGLRDASLTAKINLAAKQFSVLDLLGFDPVKEPPPDDLPYPCDCGLENQRGRKFCKQCKRRLLIPGRYRVWMEALANTYVAERCGIVFGARYADVLKWLPSMRPYPGDDDEIQFLREAIYAVTHVVYTLNDYGTYKLSPRWLPREFAFLKSNVEAACVRNDPEILGELLDSLKAFGLGANHPLILRGTRYLLAQQNADGSWGDPEDDNIRSRCHTTWTAIDGLRTCAWRGERLSLPAVKPILKS